MLFRTNFSSVLDAQVLSGDNLHELNMASGM